MQQLALFPFSAIADLSKSLSLRII